MAINFLASIETKLSLDSDVDECRISQPCDHTCINLPGSFECTCGVGFQLLDDSSTCAGKHYVPCSSIVLCSLSFFLLGGSKFKVQGAVGVVVGVALKFSNEL